MRAVSSFAGLLFLLGGVAVFAAAVLLVVAWERATRSPSSSFKRFQRSTHSLNKIHRKQATLKESDRARARALHPAARPAERSTRRPA